MLYSGIMGPKGMDRSLVRRLNAEFAKVVQAPEVRNVYEELKSTLAHFGLGFSDVVKGTVYTRTMDKDMGSAPVGAWVRGA